MRLPGNLGQLLHGQTTSMWYRPPKNRPPRVQNGVSASAILSARGTGWFAYLIWGSNTKGPFIVAPSSDPVCTVKVEKRNLVSRKYKAGRRGV